MGRSIETSFLMLFLATALCWGQSNAAQPEILRSLPPARLRSLLQGMGFEFTEESKDTTSVFNFQLEGYKVILFDQTTDLQLYSGFSDTVDAAKVNKWNQKYRFSRAYVNDNGNPSIESDLDLQGGVTKEHVEAFIRQFRTSLGVYAQFLTSPASTSSIETTTKAEPMHQKSASATTKIKTPLGNFLLWIDPTKWKEEASKEPGTLEFRSANGEGYARVITERIGIPTDALPEIALSNARKVAPDARIVLQEKRIVNGREVLAMQIEGTTKNIPFRYYGYYHGGTSGTIQVIAYTVSTAFDQNRDDFTALLDGLEILDQELPLPVKTAARDEASGVLSVNGGTMSIRYDPTKWKQDESKEVGRFSFNHSKGDAFALVISERIPVPLDSLPDIALTNAKEIDPNASITFREKRHVNGVDVWFLKLKAVASGIPLIYYGYYYGGKSGTIQILTYTGTNLVDEYESDFMDFLNGFHVSGSF